MNSYTSRGRNMQYTRPGWPVEVGTGRRVNPETGAPIGLGGNSPGPHVEENLTPEPLPGFAPPSGFGSGSPNTNNMPWLQAWNGPFAAPLSPWESKGIKGISDFADQGFGLDKAQNYLNDVFGGKYLNGNDPNFAAIESSGETLKQMEDDRALRELQSRAAAGGNAISGALMGQEGDYLRGSNAAFQNMMAQLRAANYGRERGFQQEAVNGARGISGDILSGYGALTAAGGIPREIADREIAGQYGDFLRQGRDFRDAYQYPDQLALQTAHLGYPGAHPNSFGESDASQLAAFLAQAFGGGGIGGGIQDFISSLLGGGEQAGGADVTNTVPAADGVYAYDGPNPLHTAPDSYRDSAGYNAALSAMQAENAASIKNAGKASGAGKAMTILALLMQVLGLGKNGQGAGKGKGKGSPSLGSQAGDAARKALDSLTSKNPYTSSDPKLAAEWNKYFEKSGKPREAAKPADLYHPENNPIEKIPGYGSDESLLGDTTDWTSQSNFNEGNDNPFIDSQLFGGGDVNDVWNQTFGGDYNRDLSENLDLGGGGNYDFNQGPAPDLGLGGGNEFTLDNTGGDAAFPVDFGGE